MKVLLYEQPFGQSMSAIHAHELWSEMRRLGVDADFLTEEPKLPETVARVVPRLAGPPPGLRWTRPRSVYSHLRFRALTAQPFRSLATLKKVRQAERNLLHLAELYPKPDIVYRRHNYLDSHVTYAHSLGVPAVTEVNGILQDETKLNWWASPLSNRIVARWENSRFGFAEHYIAVSEHLEHVLVERFGVPPEKITIILNGVNTNRFTPTAPVQAKRMLGLNESIQYILFSGSLQPWQGVEYLIKAMPSIRQRFPGVTLLIIGSGLLHDRLQQQASPLADSVKFLGQVPHKQVPLYISASSVCLLPRTKEHNNAVGISPLKLCEYLSCARPVVASDIRGLEYLHYEHCGILVPPENPKALAAAVCEILGNRTMAWKMGQNGRDYVVAHRSWKQAAEKTLAVCQKVVEEYR